MRLLFLTPQLPYPPRKGTTLRNFNLIKGLAARHQVDLLSFIESPAELEVPSPLVELCRRVEGVGAPRRPLARRARDTLLSAWPDMALRLWSPEFAARLSEWLTHENYDIVQVEGIEMARYGLEIARRASRPAIVFDDHNCEYVLQQRAFETDVRQPARWIGAVYSFIQWQKLRHFEAQVCRAADHVVAVSDADAAALRRLVTDLDVTVVPNGIDLSTFHLPPSTFHFPPSTFNLVFVGTMDFRPNVDAVLWFAHEILPRVLEGEPRAHFYIVGQRPHPRLKALHNHPAITVTGDIEDVRPFVRDATVYVVPLRMGGGTRFKILEAAAARKAIVSTTLGCEGFPVQHGRELLIADTPADFARAVVTLLYDADRRARLGEAAFALAQAFEWGKIIPRLEAVYGDRDRDKR